MKKCLLVLSLLFAGFFTHSNYEVKAVNIQTYTSKALLDDPTYLAFVAALAVDVITCIGNDAVNIATNLAGGDMGKAASSALQTAGDFMGNGCHKKLSKGIFGCDSYEDIGMIDSITEIAGKTKKARVCAANTIAKTLLRATGTIVGAIMGCAICGELTGNALSIFTEMITIKAKYKGARQKSEQYEVCLNEDPLADGRPMPYTDSQIIKLLKLAGEVPSIGNIVDKYNKLCLHDLTNDIYSFHKKDSVLDNIYITHMTGYAYVYCASVFSACPCIYNLQHGNVDEPEYEYDENGVIKVDEDTGQLVFAKGDFASSDAAKEDYQKHYAKHCRIIRYKDLYEQQNDLLPVFGDACYDNHGYSKANIPLTSAFVQCIEDTAKNIFEKPIFSSKRNSSPSDDMIAIYNQDINYIKTQYEKLQKIIQGRTLKKIELGDEVNFRQDELDAGLQILKSIYYTNDRNVFQTHAIEYNCKEGQDGKYTTTRYTTDIYGKYIDGFVVNNATPNCCYTSDEVINNADTCFSNQIKIDGANYSTAILKDTHSITANTFLYEASKIGLLIDELTIKHTNCNKAFSLKITNTEQTTWTLFDLFRVKIKALAVIAITLWFCLLGWKLLNGDFGSMKQEEFAKMIIKIVLCYFMIFNDNMKNFVFNWMINGVNGIGMILNETMSTLRTQNDNVFGGKCNFHISNQTIFARYNNTGIVIEATREIDKKKTDDNGKEYYSYKFSCPVNGFTYEVDQDGRRKTETKTTSWNVGDIAKGEHCVDKGEGKVCITNQDFNIGDFSINWSKKEKEIDDCIEYDDNNECIKKNCHIYENSNCSVLSTSDGAKYEFVCNRYKDFTDNEGVVRSVCIDGICKLNRTTFIPRPPFERPYKYFQFHDTDKGVEKVLAPHCHKASTPDIIDDDGRKKVYAYDVNDFVYVCTHKDTEMDAGYRINDLIDIGLLDADASSIRLFKGLLTEDEQNMLNDSIIIDEKTHDTQLTNKIRGMVVPTAVATTNSGGVVKEIDFSVGNLATTGFQRQQYQKYLTSRLAYVNKGSNYPVLKQYGLTRNYSYVSMWDMVDCKFMQYLTFSASGSALGENIEETLRSATTSGVSAQTLQATAVSFIEMLKYIFLAFPFGVACFMISMIVGFMLFLLIARAAQQYAMCIFNLVCVMYLSPVVFVLYLFNQTEGALDKWIGDVKKNICGACIPFISISVFLVVIDWVFFGDPAHYKDRQLFLSTGIINPKCYEGHLSDAPVACLSTRLLNKYSLNGGIFELLFGWVKALFQKETWRLAFYLVLKLLLGAGVIMMLTQALDSIEKKIYDLLGGEPDTNINMGFEGSAADAIKGGAQAGWEVFKATGGVPFQTAFNQVFKPIGDKITNIIRDLFSGNGGNQPPPPPPPPGNNSGNSQNINRGTNINYNIDPQQVAQYVNNLGIPFLNNIQPEQINKGMQMLQQSNILPNGNQNNLMNNPLSQQMNGGAGGISGGSGNGGAGGIGGAPLGGSSGGGNIEDLTKQLQDMNSKMSSKLSEMGVSGRGGAEGSGSVGSGGADSSGSANSGGSSSSSQKESKSAQITVSRPKLDDTE